MCQSFGALKKALELIQKTGDRCIILTEAGEEAFVVMSLAEYERLALRKSDVAALTEDELLDKINRDIAVWKSQQEEDQEEDNQEEKWEDSEDLEEKDEDWDEWSEDEDDVLEEDPYYFESIDR